MFTNIDGGHHIRSERSRGEVDRPLAVRRENRRMRCMRGGRRCIEHNANVRIDRVSAQPIEAPVGPQDPEAQSSSQAFARRVEPDHESDFYILTAPQ
jgi:hypothetical protein